jgi:glutamyl-tRNA reductase
MVVIDIAVPRDFEPSLHDGETMCLYNIDDLQKVREARIAERRRHIGAAESLVENEVAAFGADWSRRRNGPVIARLTRDFEAKRKVVVEQLMQKIAGRVASEDRATIEGAFRLLQNQFLHGPISALAEETSRPATGQHTLLDALRKLFRIHD